MNGLKYVAREIIGLFVDDGSFALAMLTVICVSATIVVIVPDLAIGAGAVLLIGCLAVLFDSVLKAGRR